MPGRGDENAQDQETEKDDWPEPPGYLGEAVRRAKRIGRIQNAMPQAPD